MSTLKPCAYAIEKYLKSIDKFNGSQICTNENKNGEFVITKWVVDGVSKPNYQTVNEWIDLYGETKPVYNSDTLISWALQQGFAASIMAHMAAFLDFANKATEVSKANFLAYATVVDLVSTANTIINKAVELGADLEEV